jgi:hypothetical protein
VIDLKAGDARPSPEPLAWRRSMAMPAGGMARTAGPLRRATAGYPMLMATSHPDPAYQADDTSFAPQAVVSPS